MKFQSKIILKDFFNENKFINYNNLIHIKINSKLFQLKLKYFDKFKPFSYL